MSERLTLPVLPLRDMVLFPGVTTPVGAGRPATLRAIEAALKTESRLIFAVAQRENVDSVSPALLYGMGTIARIGQVQRGLGGVQLVLHGEKRAAALQYAERAGHIEAVVVEAVEHHIENGLAPREATIAAMQQVSGPVVAVALVLSDGAVVRLALVSPLTKPL